MLPTTDFDVLSGISVFFFRCYSGFMRKELSDTAERLLERTIVVIEEHGAAAIRVHEVAADCGVTATTLYRLFGSREGLVHKAQAARFQRLMNDDAVFAERLRAITTEEALRPFLEATIDYYMSEPANQLRRRRRLFILGSSEGLPELQAEILAELSAAHDQAIAALTEVAERGWLRDGFRAAPFVDWFISQIDGRTRYEFPSVKMDLSGLNDITKRATLRELFGDEG